MKKSLINLSLMGVIAINLSGCFGESISCSSESVQRLVKESTLPVTKENMVAQLLNEKSPASGMLYLAAKKLADMYGTKPKFEEMSGLESIAEVKATVESEYSNLKFLLADIRTLEKDQELNRVECTGKITINTPRYEISYNVEYNAQLGDDKKKIFVEISNLE